MHVHVCPCLSMCVCVCAKSEYSRVAFYEAANILLHVLNWAAPSLCVSVCFCLRLLKFQHWCQVSLPAACSDDASAVSAVTVTVCTGVCTCVCVCVCVRVYPQCALFYC